MSSDIVQGVEKSWTETPPANPTLRHAIGEVVESQTWLDSLANPIQKWLLTFFGQPGQPNRKLKDMLNGTWLGHALHPAITDVPMSTCACTDFAPRPAMAVALDGEVIPRGRWQETELIDGAHVEIVVAVQGG